MSLLLLASLLSALYSLLWAPFWLALLFTMVVVGGVMILLGYVSAVNQNPSVSTTYKAPITLAPLALASEIKMIITSSPEPNSTTAMVLSTPIVFPSCYLGTLFLIMYLLLVLISVVKTSSYYEGPLRETF